MISSPEPVHTPSELPDQGSRRGSRLRARRELEQAAARRREERARRFRRIVFVAALFGIAAFVGLHAWREHEAHAGQLTDGTSFAASVESAGVRHAVWSPARPLTGGVNSAAGTTRAALSPDGRHLVFAVGARGLNADLWIADMSGGEPRDPRPLAEVNGPFDEMAPAFGRDALYFASDRPGGAGALDVWSAPLVVGADDRLEFGRPEHLAGPINSSFDDTDPAPARGTDQVGSEELVFASNRGGDFDLYSARGPDAGMEVVPLSALNSSGDDREPCVDPSGRLLYFASKRFGTDGFDLFRAVRAAQDGGAGREWGGVEALTGLDSDADDRAPLPLANGFEILFVRSAIVRPDAATGTQGTLPEASVLVRSDSIELVRVPARAWTWSEIAVIASLCVLALLALATGRSLVLDTFFKCYALSVLLHVLLFVWCQATRNELPVPTDATGDESAPGLQLDLRSSLTRGAGGRGAPDASGAFGDFGESGPLAHEIVRTREAESTAFDPTQGRLATATAFEEPAAPDRSKSPQDLPDGVARSTSRAVELSDRDARTARPAAPSPAFDVAGLASRALPETASDEIVGAPDASRGTTAGARVHPSATASDLARGPARALDVAVSPVDSSPAPTRAPLEGALRGPTAPGAVALADREPERARSQSSARGAASSDDALLAGLLPSTESNAGGRSGAPDSAGSGSTDSASTAASSTGEESSAAEAGPARAKLGARGEPRAPAPAGAPLVVSGPSKGSAGGHSSDPGSGPANGLADKPPGGDSDGFGDGPADGVERGAKRSPWAGTPYANRTGVAKERALRDHGGSAETERAVDRALRYLASVQDQRGFWGQLETVDDKYGRVCVGKTALCTLAFLGAGHTHVSGTPHSGTVARALAFLMAVQDETSGHFGDSDAYSHGIATYALAEAYALTRDESLQKSLEPAIAHILAHQSKRRDARYFGGWSYYYSDERTFDRWPRTSITAWQVMALESARLAGLAVPDAAFADAAAFLDHAREEEAGWYRYDHDPVRLGSGYPTLPASTPAALFALSITGRDITRAEFDAPRAFVLERAPEAYRAPSENDFVLRGQGNPYFWYYGTLAMFRAGGGAWATWNAAMKRTLLPAQTADGSWKPIDVYARQYAHDDDRDRSYTTALCVLSLEVYYRYFLPLLQVR